MAPVSEQRRDEIAEEMRAIASDMIAAMGCVGLTPERVKGHCDSLNAMADQLDGSVHIGFVPRVIEGGLGDV
jgi:predicted transcriptional regulator